MMAQEMFEENKVLQSEIDGFRSLIQRWIPHMTSQMHDVDKMREEFEDSLEDNDDEEEICEECLMIIEDCECEENEDE